MGDHDVRVAAYFRNHRWLDRIDWSLDALRTRSKFEKSKLVDLFGLASVPNLDYQRTEMMLEDLSEWVPDLVISDCEPITAHVAYALDVELWTCSSLHLIDGIHWERLQGGGMTGVLRELRPKVKRFPQPTRRLIYSPFGDIQGRPLVREGYEWVTPYHLPVGKSPSSSRDTTSCSAQEFCSKKDLCFSTGETSLFSDRFYENRWVALFPDLEDPDQVLNAILFKWYGIGGNIGDLNDSEQELSINFERIERSKIDGDYVSRQPWGYLHEKMFGV